MPTLDTKFQAIMEYLKHPTSHHHTGDKMICYLTYDPNKTIEVKRKLGTWLSLAKGYGFSVQTLSLATLLNDYFKQNPRRNKWIIPDVDDGQEEIAEFFKNDLGSMIIENKVIESAILVKQKELEKLHQPLLIITDLEAIHPFTRFGPVEQNIYPELIIPLLILYPGTINGSSLEFLGFYPQDGNYRSKHF